MSSLLINKISQPKQYLASLAAIALVAVVCFKLSAYMGYHVIAFVLLLTVSIIAMLFDILPVLVAAAVTALVWDFFFIPPRFTFQVGTTEDSILLLMYFVIAMISAALTYKIRQIEKL